MHNDASTRRVGVSLVRVPADIASAYDGGRRTSACHRKQTSIEGGTEDSFSERPYTHLHSRFRTRDNVEWRISFRRTAFASNVRGPMIASK